MVGRLLESLLGLLGDLFGGAQKTVDANFGWMARIYTLVILAITTVMAITTWHNLDIVTWACVGFYGISTIALLLVSLYWTIVGLWIDVSRRVIQRLCWFTATLMVIGIWFALIPMHAFPPMIPTILLGGMALGFLWGVGPESRWMHLFKGTIVVGLICAFIVPIGANYVALKAARDAEYVVVHAATVKRNGAASEQLGRLVDRDGVKVLQYWFTENGHRRVNTVEYVPGAFSPDPGTGLIRNGGWYDHNPIQGLVVMNEGVGSEFIATGHLYTRILRHSDPSPRRVTELSIRRATRTELKEHRKVFESLR